MMVKIGLELLQLKQGPTQHIQKRQGQTLHSHLNSSFQQKKYFKQKESVKLSLKSIQM